MHVVVPNVDFFYSFVVGRHIQDVDIAEVIG